MVSFERVNFFAILSAVFYDHEIFYVFQKYRRQFFIAVEVYYSAARRIIQTHQERISPAVNVNTIFTDVYISNRKLLEDPREDFPKTALLFTPDTADTC